MYYVYLHIKLNTGEPFYVGKGKANRHTSLHGRNSWWKNIVSKYNYDIIFLEEKLTGEQAEELEKYWIKRIGRRDLNLGSLINLTDGGDGVAGRKSSINSREKMRGNNNPFFNQTHSEEIRNKIKEANKKRIHTEESKLKRNKNILISTKYGEIHPVSRLVINLETGIFYISIREAAKTIDMNEDILRYHLNRKEKNKTNFKFI